MSDEIPEAEIDRAFKLAVAWLRQERDHDVRDQQSLSDVIARAVMAERERCAKIADEGVFDEHALAQATEQGVGYHNAASIIASAIRSSHE